MSRPYENRGMAWGLLATVAFAGMAFATEATAEPLPAPYSAEQIRDAWVEGFWLETRVTTPAGAEVSRTEVVGWSEDAATMRQIAKAPSGQEGERASNPITMTWEQLRSHAVFPSATTERRRDSKQTPLGTFEGWSYRTVEGEEVFEYFFADGLPGPPVLFSHWRGSDRLMLAEQTARAGF